MTTTVSVAVDVDLPSGLAAENISLRFDLSGVDTEGDTVIAPLSLLYNFATGAGSVDLWVNSEGAESTFYAVTLIHTLGDAYGREVRVGERPLGGIALGDAASYSLAERLRNSVIPGGGGSAEQALYDALLDARDAAVASQAAAATSASNAATSATNAATSETNAAASAASAAASSATAGINSGRLEVATFAQVATEFGYAGSGRPRIVAEGDMLRVVGTGFVYQVAAAGVSDAFPDYSASGGVKLYALPDSENVLSLRAFGPGAVGLTNDTAPVVAFFARAKALGCRWHVPNGVYNIDPSAPIEIATSGVCEGTFRLPQTNTASWFSIVRDDAGAVVSAAAWNTLSRGTRVANAANARGKNIYIASSEILIERVGGSPYLKQELIRVNDRGDFTTPLCCSYTSNSGLTVTAHTPSRPISVEGLAVRRYGTSTAVTQTIRCSRDNVEMNSPEVINENPASPLAQGIVIAYCADVTLNKPRATGLQYSGLGYGILTTGTIGVTVNDAVVQDARHGLSGAYTADTTINGGNWSDGIDDHWGNRMTINDAKVYCPDGGSAVLYAGYDITINDISVVGGRNVLAIRTDTPSLGGTVRMRNINIVSHPATGTTYYMFGFASPTLTITGTTFTTKPTMPDLVEIDGVSWDIGAGFTNAYVAYLSCLNSPHTNWGDVTLKGPCSFKGATAVNAIFLVKDATKQEDRAATLEVLGNVDCGIGNVIYSYAVDADNTRAALCRVEGSAGNIRASAFSAQEIKVSGARIRNVTNDNAAHTFTNQRWQFHDCNMVGTSISSTLRNILFSGCVFETAYTTFPRVSSVNYATMVGNVSIVAQAAMPADIRATIVAPYNGV